MGRNSHFVWKNQEHVDQAGTRLVDARDLEAVPAGRRP
jgi:hypothetical protein